MKLLGLSAFYHDSAAAIIEDGRVTAAMEEERFTRVKHAYQFPYAAIDACLNMRNLTIDDIDAVTHYEKPLLRFERVLDNFVKTYPFSLKPFVKGIPEWVDQKIKVEQIIRKKLKFNGDIYYVPHHVSHASASYFPSGFPEAAVLTIDGIGEYQTTGLWKGDGSTLRSLGSIDFPHSIGLFYSTFTAFLGFRINEDEYKVMGLGAYGKPTYLQQMQELVDLKDDGSFRLDLSYFAFREAMRMWTNKFEEVFGKPRLPHEPITTRHKNIAASCQAMTESIYFAMLNHLYRLTGTKNVCLGGGVALNALANGKIYTHTPFKKVYILGPAGDGGSAVGAPLFIYHHVLNHEKRKKITSLRLGTHFSDEEIEQVLKEKKTYLSKISINDFVS